MATSQANGSMSRGWPPQSSRDSAALRSTSFSITGAPEGFVEVAYVDCEKRYRSKLPWQRDGGIGGLFLRDDLFIRIMSRFAAHVPLVRVKHSYGWRVEPAKPEWDAPKAVIYEREWQAKKAAREAAKRDLAYPVDAEA